MVGVAGLEPPDASTMPANDLQEESGSRGTESGTVSRDLPVQEKFLVLKSAFKRLSRQDRATLLRMLEAEGTE